MQIPMFGQNIPQNVLRLQAGLSVGLLELFLCPPSLPVLLLSGIQSSLQLWPYHNVQGQNQPGQVVHWENRHEYTPPVEVLPMFV